MTLDLSGSFWHFGLSHETNDNFVIKFCLKFNLNFNASKLGKSLPSSRCPGKTPTGIFSVKISQKIGFGGKSAKCLQWSDEISCIIIIILVCMCSCSFTIRIRFVNYHVKPLNAFNHVSQFHSFGASLDIHQAKNWQLTQQLRNSEILYLWHLFILLLSLGSATKKYSCDLCWKHFKLSVRIFTVR